MRNGTRTTQGSDARITDGAKALAQTIADAHKTGRHGKPTVRVEEATVFIDFAGTDEFPPSSFTITVRQTKGER